MKNDIRRPNYPMAVLMGLLCVFCMFMIFMFSYQSADVSAGESQSLYDLFVKLFGGREIISHNAFRKLAHFSEYTAFSFSFFGMLYFIKKRFCGYSGFIFCLIYSMSDEIHQYFVPERACRPFDVFVDSLGIVFGMAVFFVLAVLISKIAKKSVA